MGWQGSERKGASTSEMGRFETEFLTQEDNRQALARMNTRWVERAMAHTLHQRVILDMDSSESPVHGQQEGAAYNGLLQQQSGCCFALMPPSPSRRYTSIWRPDRSTTPSGCQQTKCYRSATEEDSAPADTAY